MENNQFFYWLFCLFAVNNVQNVSKTSFVFVIVFSPPYRDNPNDWVQIGDDNGVSQRVCLRHNERYSAPPWGIRTGSCPPWNRERVCDLKRHGFAVESELVKLKQTATFW